MREEEVILYLKTAEGNVMAVPESKLKEFQALNEKIKARMKQKEKNTFEDAMAATEEMFANAMETPKQTTSNEKKRISHETKDEKQKNIDKQMGVNKMNKIKIRQTSILIVAYVILIVIELFFFVPYHSIQIFRTQNNVTRTEIIGSGYTSMVDITSDDAYIPSSKILSSAGKIVNTPQLFMNVSITTVLAVGIYLLLQKKDKRSIEDDAQIPMLDINALAFATEEEIVQAQIEYAQKMAEYIKNKGDI